jgi:hypothetical protein
MGGGSAQIAFEVPEGRAHEYPKEDLVTVTLTVRCCPYDVALLLQAILDPRGTMELHACCLSK